MSLKKEIYKAISHRLKERVPAINWIDKNKGQLRNMPSDFIQAPVVLISFANGQYSSTGNGVQEGTLIVKIETGYENYADSFEGSINQEEAFKFWDFNQAVHNALQGFSTDGFSPLDRVQDAEDDDHDQFIITETLYSTHVKDTAAARSRFLKLAPTEDLDVEVSPD